MDFNVLEKQLERGTIPNYLILLSTDVQRPSNIINQYKKKVQFPELNCIELDGETIKFSKLNEDIEKLPFMDHQTLIIVTKATSFLFNVDKNKILKELNKKNIPQHCNLILQGYIKEDEKIRKNTKLAKLEKQGAIVVYNTKFTLKDGIKELQKQNINLQPNIINYIYRQNGTNIDIFINECKKISMLEKDQLTVEMLDNVISKNTLNATFDIIDILIKEKNLQKGLEILNNLLEQGTHPLEIFAAINSQIKLLYYAKQFIIINKTNTDFAKEFKLHPFRAKIGFQQADNFTEEQLSKLFVDSNKSNNIKLSADPKIELEKIIIKLFTK